MRFLVVIILLLPLFCAAQHNVKADEARVNGVRTGRVLFYTDSLYENGPGVLRWNPTDETLDLGLDSAVTLQIGQETHIKVVNKTGVDLLEADYDAVYISGVQGQRLKVDKANAKFAESNKTIGLVTEDILNNQQGFVTTFGLVREINTTGALQGETWTDGDILYVDTLDGGLTNTILSAPNHVVSIGYVVHAHAQHGYIFVKPENVAHLEDIHTVALDSLGNGAQLLYNSTSELWESTLYEYTEAERDNIPSPVAGRTIYCSDCTANDTSTGVVQTYNGSSWKNHW